MEAPGMPLSVVVSNVKFAGRGTNWWFKRVPTTASRFLICPRKARGDLHEVELRMARRLVSGEMRMQKSRVRGGVEC